MRIGTQNNVYITIPRESTPPISKKITLKRPFIGPLSAHALVGEMQLLCENKCLAKVPLVTLEAVDEPSWFQKKIIHLMVSLLPDRN